MAIHFTSASYERITLGSIPMDVTQDFTIAVWAKSVNPASGGQMVYSQLAEDTSECPAVGFASGKARFLCYKWPSALNLEDATGVASDTWVHIAAVRSGTTNYLYTNGVERVNGAFTTMATPGYATVGANVGSGAYSVYWLNGDAADLRIYQRALSANEIYALYASWGAALIPPDLFHLQGVGLHNASAANPVDISPAKISLSSGYPPVYSASPHSLLPPPLVTA